MNTVILFIIVFFDRQFSHYKLMEVTGDRVTDKYVEYNIVLRGSNIYVFFRLTETYLFFRGYKFCNKIV